MPRRRTIRLLQLLTLLPTILIFGGCDSLLTSDGGNEPSVVEAYDLDPPLVPSVGGSLYLDVDTDLPPTINWASGGGGSGIYRVRVNGAQWETLLAPPPYVATEVTTVGEYVFEVQERDSSGNWSGSGEFVFRVVPDIPPAPTVTSPNGAAGSFISLSTPTWDWTDLGTVDVAQNWRHSFDLTNWTETTAQTFAPSPLPDGTYTLYVEQELTLGGSTAPGSLYLTIDTQPPPVPTVSVKTAAGSYVVPGSVVETHQDPITLRLDSAVGGGGNGNISYSYDGGALVPTLSGDDTTIALVELPATGALTAGESDAAGNFATGATGVSLGTDSTSPVVSGPALTASQRPTWSWTNTQAGSGSYQITISNGSPPPGFTTIVESVSGNSFTPSSDLPTAQGAPYNISVVAYDDYGFPSAPGALAGGTEIVPGGDLEISITLDEPSDKTINLTGDSTVDISGTFSASVAPAFTVSSYAWYVNGANQGAGSAISFQPSSIGLFAGTHRLQLFYTVVDGGGNSQLYSAELYFDVTN